MSSQTAYTNKACPHPNLLVGCFQLLYWLMFRPSVWRNYIRQIDPLLDCNFSLLQLIVRPRLNQLQSFLLQGFFLLPIFSSLLAGIIVYGYGSSYKEATLIIFFSSLFGILNGLTLGCAIGVTYGILNGVALSIVAYLFNPIAFGLLNGIAYGAAYSATDRKITGLLGGILGGLFAGLIGQLLNRNINPFALVMFSGFAGWIVPVITLFVASGIQGIMIEHLNAVRGLFGGLAFGVSIHFLGNSSNSVGLGVAVSIGLWFNWWRPFLMALLFMPLHILIYRFDVGLIRVLPCQFHRHLAFWDEWQVFPIPGLDRHLLAVLKRFPLEGTTALNYLSTSRQRWAAQSAQIELDAAQLECCESKDAIAQSHQKLLVGDLQGPADTLFRSFNRISEDVSAALQQSSSYNQRLALTMVSDRLDALLRELTRSSDKYAVRFRPIAQHWGKIIAKTLQDLAVASELNQEIDCPYIIGVPLTQRQSIFVGRTDITARMEHLIRDQQSPPLLLYGQRRMGKTSLLNNLGRLLPSHIIPLFIDLQGPASRANHHRGFLYNLARGMIHSAQHQRNLSLPPLSRESLDIDPFTRFDEWLDDVETALGESIALLALDEFEALDHALLDGRYDESIVLGMFRNLIQHRYRFKVLFSGSHALSEFQRWSSYLINAQVLHLGNLTPTEARQLIEQPIETFSLQYQPKACERVLALTQGHPYLVQLLCAEIVFLKNEQSPSQRRLATLEDINAAIPQALSNGSMFFSDIEHNQLTPDALRLLRHIAQFGEGAVIPPDLLRLDGQKDDDPAMIKERSTPFGPQTTAIALLLQRELIQKTASGYRFQIELIRRWFVDQPR